MRHFDTWLIRDPYSIFHYYPSGRRWSETLREMIQTRQICSPDAASNASNTPIPFADSTSQPTSAFFQRLPPEIRLMIYAYVFGEDTTIHLVQVKDQIRHVRCTHPAPLEKHRQCCPATVARWRTLTSNPTTNTTTTNTSTTNTRTTSKPTTTPSPPQPSKESEPPSKLYPHTSPLLPPLLSTPQHTTAPLHTCKAMYTESAPLLYRTFTFDTDDLYTLLAFTTHLPPPHRHSLRALTIHYTPIWTPFSTDEPHAFSVYTHTHNDELWVAVWEVVRRCTGLEVVRLGLDLGRWVGVGMGGNAGRVAGGRRVPFGVREKWVQPVLKVRGLKRFELGVVVKCDRVARRVLEVDGLVREVEAFREGVSRVVCQPREEEEED
ncbi:uncharacterized protein BO80DRAFT_325667, partial [Aspergillus ibericus CBS 121593]